MKRKSFLVIFGIYFSLAFTLGFLLWLGGSLRPVGGPKDNVSFVIDKGEGVSEIASRLKEQNLIKNELSFKVWTVAAGIARKIKAGNYYLSGSMTTQEIARTLTKGSADRWFTFTEGLRAEQIGELLIRGGFAIDPGEWEKEVKAEKLEGQLFPDSYLFPQSSTQAAILKIIKKNFQKKAIEGLKDEWSASGQNQNFVLTLASLVEREAKTEEDKALVAGILLKRLEADWPLQVDASVQYAVANRDCFQLKSLCDWWSNRLSQKDMQIQSPYNTYLGKGLPPGPICNPGVFSIKAVLNPTQSSYWYYISGKDGAMHYAKTSEEHQKNIQKFLQ